MSVLLWALLPILLIAFAALDADWLVYVLPAPETASKVFNGRVVWITGASSGIGAQLAIDLAAQGAQVVVSARREGNLKEIADKCGAVGLPAMVLPLDVTDIDSQQTAYKSIIDRFGHVDELVLNAGRSQRQAAMDAALEQTRDIFELNFFSYVALTKLIVPGMIDRHDGQIVVLSSVSGKMGTPGASSYSATKFALHGYFDALRAEVGQYNVSVMMVCPGPVESEIATKAIRTVTAGVAEPEEGKKMATSRCTELIVKGMYYRLDEIWMADQPILSVVYIATYFPRLMNFIAVKIAGPNRLKAIKTGTNIYDMKATFGFK